MTHFCQKFGGRRRRPPPWAGPAYYATISPLLLPPPEIPMSLIPVNGGGKRGSVKVRFSDQIVKALGAKNRTADVRRLPDSKLACLESLNLKGCKATHLPREIGKLTSLECGSVHVLHNSNKQKLLSDVAVTESKSHLVRAYQNGPVVSLSDNKNRGEASKRECIPKSIIRSEDLQQHSGGRRDNAAKSFCDSLAWKSLVVDSLPLREQSNSIRNLTQQRTLTHKHCVRLKKSPDQPQSMLRDCLGGLAAQSTIGLPDGGHVLPLLEKKMVRKALKRKCRSMSVLSLVDRQQHVDRRLEDAAKNIGVKRNCGQLMIHCVSRAKRICRQHEIYHRWPFEQDWATVKGHSFGDERPIEVFCISSHVKLGSRLQLIYISWLDRFLPRPLALAGGGEIGGPIVSSCSGSAATNNSAQLFGRDQSGSAASDSENERTREQEDFKEIYTNVTKDDLRRLCGRMNRQDAAVSLNVSVATFKRKCREFGIKRWPHVRNKKVGRPPDRNGKGNTPTVREMPSHNVGMEGGRNQEAIALNTKSGSIMVSRPLGQHGERYTSTACEMPSHNVETGMEVEPVGQNQEADMLEQDFMGGPIALNTDGVTFTECSDAAAPSQSNEEFWGNIFASAEAHLLEENHGSIKLTAPSCFDPSPSQPMPAIPHTMPTTPQMMPLLTERQDMGLVRLKAVYGDISLKFDFSPLSKFSELKEEVSKRLSGGFELRYADEEGDLVLIACDDDVRDYLRQRNSLGNQVIKLFVLDKVPNATNVCDKCGWLRDHSYA